MSFWSFHLPFPLLKPTHADHITVGSLPPYLMQSNHNLQNGLGLPVQMYQNASALAMQQAQAQQHRQQQHQPALHPHSGRDMDDIMADSGLNRAWDMFGGQYKPI